MITQKKKVSLLKFKEQIKEKLTFFYPEYNGVKGFFGNGDVFFVCQKPSTGHFPSEKDKFFYNLLKKYGFKNAHITDLIKTRGKVITSISKDEFELNWSILEEEIEMLKPKLIVAVGNDAYNNLKYRIREIRLVKIIHYAFRYGNKERIKKRLEEDIKRVRKEADKFGPIDGSV